MVDNKSRFITPAVMLIAGAISMLIMILKHFDLYRMLWILLVVLIIFFVIGDIARYLYSTIRPRIIPATLDLEHITQQAEQRMNAGYSSGEEDGSNLQEAFYSSGEAQEEGEEHYLDDTFEEYSEESLK